MERLPFMSAYVVPEERGEGAFFLVYLDDINHEKVGQISWKPCDMGVKNLESNHNF